MTTFKGYGPGIRGGWKKRRYLPGGVVVDGDAPAPAAKRSPSIHTRFVPHVNHALTAEDAAAIGAQRTPDKGTYIETEAQLNRYLAREKFYGRSACWKQH